MPSNARISHVLHTEVNYMVNDKSVDTSKIIEKIMVELIPEKDWLRLDINEIRSEFCCAYAACFGKLLTINMFIFINHKYFKFKDLSISIGKKKI